MAVLAVGGSCTALEVGQYGLVVTALLAGALWLDETGHEAWSGLLVALAMCKPTIAGPFFLALVLRRRYRAVAAASLYWGAASLAVWLTVKTGPLEMLQQMVHMGGSIADHGTWGVTELLLELGLTGSQATLTAMALVLAVTLPLLALWPDKSLASAFAVTAVAGRLWTYHKNYDNVMLVFLLIALGARALDRKRLAAIVGFLIAGVFLWLPPRLAAPSSVQVAQAFAWPVGLAALWLAQSGALSVPGFLRASSRPGLASFPQVR